MAWNENENHVIGNGCEVNSSDIQWKCQCTEINEWMNQWMIECMNGMSWHWMTWNWNWTCNLNWNYLKSKWNGMTDKLNNKWTDVLTWNEWVSRHEIKWKSQMMYVTMKLKCEDVKLHENENELKCMNEWMNDCNELTWDEIEIQL